MFRKMAEESSFCEEILRVIMNDSGLIVLESHAQWVGQNLQGRSVILDAKCQLSNGKVVNIEVQKANDDNHQKRVRYNGAILTTNITDTGLKFENVPDVCIVFISKFDVFHSGYSLYNIDRIVRQTGEVVNNGFEEIYVSACVKDGSDVSELMDIFTNDESYNVNKYPVTSNIKKRYKQTKEGQSVMCEIMDVIERINVELGSTVIMATHDKEIVNRMKKRVVCLNQGVLVSDQKKGKYIEHENI